MSNEQTFREEWLKAVYIKNSVLCAGIDPAEFGMGRKKKGLNEDVDKLDWAIRYIKVVAPFIAAIKPNLQYWKDSKDMGRLEIISVLAHDLGLVVIDDSKLADIGSTNDAGFFYAQRHGADAVTFSPFAGNMEEASNQAHNHHLGIISMCLMSNPESEREKKKLVGMIYGKGDNYKGSDIIKAKGESFVPQYIQLAHDAQKYGIDCIVVGAPSEDNHVSDEEIERVRAYVDDQMLVLMPGVGEQGGEAEVIWKYFNPDSVIVNVGRGLMFANGPDTTPKQHAEKAEYYKKMLNNLRTK